MKTKRQLNLLHVYCITTGAMISSGIFVLPGMAHALAGPAVVFSYFLAGVLAAAGLLSIAELTTAMPKAGGDYFYTSRSLGPAAGTIAALLSWFSLTLKSAFALVGIAVVISGLVNLNWHILASLFCIIFVVINLYGTKEAAGFQIILVAALLIIMFSFIYKGIDDINLQFFEPFVPYGIKSVISTTGFVFVSYGGLIQVASIAGEIKNPGKNIPRGMILAISSMIVVYTLMIFVVSGVLGSNELDNSLTPISDAAGKIMGNAGFRIITVAACLAFITTANAGIMTASRYLMALSKDQLLPSFLARLSKKSGVPYFSVIITGLVILIAVFVNLKILVEAASIVFVLGYILASVAVIVLRQSGIQNYHPRYKAPFYPWLQLITIICFSFVIFEMGEDSFFITAFIIIVGFMIYWFYGRKKAEKDSALLHLIEKITDRKLVTGQLENELKEIIRERDEIVLDDFDRLVERSPTLDIEGPVSLEQLFSQAVEKLPQNLPISSDEIKKLLVERENNNSTVLTSHLAVPHIVIEENNIFEMIIIRCKKGVFFSQNNQNVKSAFILIVSKDNRNFYLRVLAAIAQIFQEQDIEQKWHSVKNSENLKDILHLGKRKRI